MSNDKMREEFEAWSKKEYPGTLLATKANGDYLNLYVQMCWLGWKGSREALAIELPDDGIEDCQDAWGERCKNTFDCGYNFASLRHEQAIESAGLKVKP